MKARSIHDVEKETAAKWESKYQKAIRRMIPLITRQLLGTMALVLLDDYSFTGEQIDAVIAKINKHCSCMVTGDIDFHDVFNILKEDYGFDAYERIGDINGQG